MFMMITCNPFNNAIETYCATDVEELYSFAALLQETEGYKMFSFLKMN